MRLGRSTASPADVREYTARKEGEEAKAVRKYGADAALPGGKPDLDILDFLLNELVGIVRYADMLEHRSQQMMDFLEEVPAGTIPLCKEVRNFARELSALASRYAYDGIAFRRLLKSKGLALGLTEAAA